MRHTAVSANNVRLARLRHKRISPTDSAIRESIRILVSILSPVTHQRLRTINGAPNLLGQSTDAEDATNELKLPFSHDLLIAPH